MTAVQKIERLGDVRARQTLWVQWMQDSTEGLTDDDLVITYTDRTPFGNYLLGLSPAPCSCNPVDHAAADRLAARITELTQEVTQ